MKNRFRFLGIIATVAVIGFSATGCSSVSMINPGWDHHFILPDGEGVRDYTILGVVQVEERQTIVLGAFLPFIPIRGAGGAGIGGGSLNLLRFTRGQATYATLLAQARTRFPGANAVIGVQVDRVDSSFFIFTSSRRYTLTGLAVKFAAEPPPRAQVASLD